MEIEDDDSIYKESTEDSGTEGSQEGDGKDKEDKDVGVKDLSMVI